MPKIIKNGEYRQLPLSVHIQHFLIKYRVLSSIDLTILISPEIKSGLSFDKLQKSISVYLNKIKKEGKVSKVKPRKWEWNFSEK